jgi:drug/metabolite transporter (DMT)-like permease
VLDFIDILGPAMVGCFTAGGIVLANISAGIGIAGISNSIIHSSLVIVTVFNYFVLNQLISFEQSIGVVLTLIGGILLALGERINTCCGGAEPDQEEDSSTEANRALIHGGANR